MPRRSTFYKPSKGSTSKESEDPFAEDDLSLDFSSMKDKYGKRTGKFYVPQKWQRSPSDFYQFSNQETDENDESITPQTRIKKLRKGLGLADSSDAKSLSSKEDDQDTEIWPQIIIRKPLNAEKKSNEENKPSKGDYSRKSSRFSELIDFSFSFKESDYSSEKDSGYEQNDYQKKNQQQKVLIKSIEKSKKKKTNTKKTSQDKTNSSKSQEKKQQEPQNDQRNLRLTKSPVNYNEDLPKISIIKRKSKSKNKFEEKENSLQKRRLQQRKNERQEENRRKSNGIKISLEKRKQLEQKKQQQRKKSEEKKKMQQKKEQQLRKKEEIRRQEQRRKQEEERKSLEKLKKQRQEDEKKRKQEKRKPSKRKENIKRYEEDDQIKERNKKDKKKKPKKSSDNKEKHHQKPQKSHKNRLISPEKQRLEVEEQNSSPLPYNSRKSKKENLNDQFLKVFEDKISSIKQRRRRATGLPYDSDESLHQSLTSLIDEIDRYDLEKVQSSDMLNRAVINTRSEKNTDQNIQGQNSFDTKNIFKKNKGSNFENKDYVNENQSKRIIANEEKKKTEFKKINIDKNNDFLTDSLKKEAEQYYEKEQREFRIKNGKNLKQSEPQKIGKRSRQQFQFIKKGEDSEQDKIESKKIAKQNQKATKKRKANENQKDVKIPKDETYYSRFRKNEDENENELNQNEIAAKKKKQEQHYDLNRRLVKEADKKLKKKSRPARVSPKKKSTQKKAKTNKGPKSISNQLKLLLRKKDNNQLNQNTDVQIDGPTSIKNSSNTQEQRRYPERNRVPRLYYWSERPVYNSKRQLVKIETKHVIDKIGYVQQTSEGSFQSTFAEYRSDQYFEKLTMKSGDILDFKGFGDEYEKLQISYQRNKSNAVPYAKYIEVYKNNKLHNLEQTVTIYSCSGRFTIQNYGQQTGYIEMVLTINKYYDEDQN